MARLSSSSRFAERIVVSVHESGEGHVADVTVHDQETTTHRVRISRFERQRYGTEDVVDLVRRSFEFLLEREPNGSILREFDLSTIERYFPEYARQMSTGTSGRS